MNQNTLELLHQFQSNLKRDDFTLLFGVIHTPHLWRKFICCNHNLLDFFSLLDEPNKIILFNHINKIIK